MRYLLLLTSVLVQSCFGVGDITKVQWSKPGGRIYSYMPKTTNKVYQKAWMEGCESGMSTGFGKDFNKMFHHFKKDVRFSGLKYGDERDLFEGKSITSEDMSLYNKTWSDAMKSCRHYTLSNYKPFTPQNPGEAVGQMDDISNVYEFRSWSNGDSNIAFW